jgi:transposase
MPRGIKVIVIESEKELKDLLNQQDTQASRDKIDALFHLKTRRFNTIKELADEINQPYDTVYRWLRIYREKGLKILLGRKKSQTTKKKDEKKASPRQEDLTTTQKKRKNTTKKAKFQTLIGIDGEVILYNKILNKKESDRLFKQLLKIISWRQDYIESFGKLIPLPRLTAWYGNPDKSYTYSGINMEPEIWSPPLLLIKDKIEELLEVEFLSAGQCEVLCKG